MQDNNAMIGTAPQSGVIAPVHLQAWSQHGQIISEASDEEIARLVSEGQVVVLKGAFEAKVMLEYRAALKRWAEDNATFPHGTSPSAFPEVNFHRIDDGVIKSVCPHVFHQFGFNTIARLEEYIGKPSLEIAESMRQLQNRIAGTDFPLSLNGVRLKVLHYPSGGGFLAEHSHPLEPQRIGLIMSLSRLGEDVTTGATRFLTSAGRVDTAHSHDIGDIIVFRYDLPHEVTTVDEDKALNWDSEFGKWSVVLELRETHALSHNRQPA
jgi:hypothetical protein